MSAGKAAGTGKAASAGRRMRWNDLLARLRTSPPAGGYALCGPELRLKRECLTMMMQALVGGDAATERSRYALDTFRVGEAPLGEICAAAAQAGLFGAERLVQIEEFERLSRVRGKERDAWVAFARSRFPNPVVFTSVRNANELSRQSTLLAEMLRSLQVVEFWHLFPADAVRWVVERARRRGLRCTPSAAALLVTHVGTDLLLLESEIEKITLLRVGDGNADLDVRDLRNLVRGGFLGSSWECVAAAVEGRLREAMLGMQAARREEEAFSLAWKLAHAVQQQLGEGASEGAAAPTRSSAAPRRGFTPGASPTPAKVKENALGRLLRECYLWERNLKSGGWLGAHGYTALEGVVIDHASRAHPGRVRGDSPE